MKYFQLTSSSDIKEIGCFPQSETINNYDDFKKLDFNNVNSQFLPIPILNRKSKLTSLLTSVPIGNSDILLLERKLIELFKIILNEKFLSHQIIVKQNNKIIDNYYLFYLYLTSESEIGNFEESIFYMGNRLDWEYVGKRIKISNYDEYLNLTKNYKSNTEIVKTEKLFLNFSNLKQDIIRIGQFPLITGYFVSEKLKNIIEKEGFTGFAFQEIEEMDDRIKCIY